jgi:hypothetical protein
MTISHYLAEGLWPHCKGVSLLGIQSCRIGVGDKQERLDNCQITNWTFVQYILRREMPAEYVRRAFSRSHQRSVCQSNVYLWYREGRRGTLDCQEENTGHCAI